MIRQLSFALIFACLICGPVALLSQDWPEIRGEKGIGSFSPGGALADNETVELKVAWKKKIGSGYSSVVVANGRVIVMYSDSDEDVVACLDSNSGEETWKKTIGPRFIGKNGSFDGPISTPAIRADRVFVLSPTGRLICFDMADGSEIWSRELQEADKANLPLYGFATSPIVFEDSLIVQIGAPEKAIAAFELATGEPKWAAGEDSIDSQTPAMIRLEGEPILLSPGDKKLIGLNPVDGSILFETPHGGANGSSVTPVLFDENKLLLTVDDSFSRAVSLRPVDNKINVSEEWQERSIKNTYNIPAIHAGHAFAYSTRILTCVDTKTGKPKWKSRFPGDGFLVIVDGHLVINTKKGDLCIVKATPEEYQLVAKLELFDDLVWSLPAYSNDSVYLRSLGEVARVDIVPAKNMGNEVADKAMPLGPKFRAFINALDKNATKETRNQMIDQFLQDQTSFPIIENNIVHFVYRGSGEDVAVASDIFGARQERKMTRLSGTDFFYYALELPKDQRANYAFLVDYQMQLDPRNSSRTITSSVYAGEMEFAVRLSGADPLKMNWFSMNGWREPAFLKAIESDAPKLETIELESEKEKPPVSCDVMLPPGYDADEDQAYPVVYVLLGTQARKFGDFARIAADIYKNQGHDDYLELPPSIIVFTNNAGPNLVEKIVPAIDSQYNTIDSREGRAIVSNGFVASPGLTIAMKNANLFSAVGLQSPLVFADAKDAIIEQLAELDQPFRVYMEWGRYDMFNPHENWDIRKRGRELFQMFADNKNIQLAGGEVNDSTDWSSWRNRFDVMLQHLTNDE